MPKEWTRAACFEHYGATCKNPRWSWSARSGDGKTVVVTMWQDEFSEGGRVYESRLRTEEKKRPGATERTENIRWAREHCGDVIRVIIAKAKDVNADPREIEECFPRDNLLMRVTDLEEATGRFRAERIDPKP